MATGNILNLGRYAFKGWKHSLETRKKMSMFQKGRQIPEGTLKSLIGRPVSKETRKKRSLALKGKKLPNSTKIKMSEATKRYYLQNKNLIGKYREYGLRGLIKQQNMKEPTSIEKIVYDELKKRGLVFEKQKLINGKFLVDAYIPSLNLIIEADGDYWHSLDRVRKKDKAENAYLTKCNYKLLRLSEREINDGSFINKLN